MLDLIYIAVIIAFFALCAAYVAGCARIVGRDASVEHAQDAVPEDVGS